MIGLGNRILQFTDSSLEKKHVHSPQVLILTSMRIGFDAKRLFFNSTGLGVYSRLLLRGLKANYSDHQYLLFAAKAHTSKYGDDFNDFKVIGSRRPLWRSWAIVNDINNAGCDLYHGLSHEIPFGSKRLDCPTIVTIHDTIFKTNPELFPAIDRKIYDIKWKHSCNTSDLIVAVSQHTKEDIMKYYGVDAAKIQVIPPPVQFESLVTEKSKSSIKHQYDLPDDFLLFVGSITRRKNLLGVLQAMAILPREQCPPLVIIGTGKAKAEAQDFIRKTHLANKVKWVGYIANSQLPVFYTLAHAFVYPSFYEGFGIPIVEALLYNTPVITSMTSSMPEAAGPGALLVDPSSPIEISSAIQTIYDDPTLSERLASKGNAYVQRFTVNSVCDQMMSTYQKVSSNY